MHSAGSHDLRSVGGVHISPNHEERRLVCAVLHLSCCIVERVKRPEAFQFYVSAYTVAKTRRYMVILHLSPMLRTAKHRAEPVENLSCLARLNYLHKT